MVIEWCGEQRRQPIFCKLIHISMPWCRSIHIDDVEHVKDESQDINESSDEAATSDLLRIRF
jgi:hypothetical protein